MKNKYLERVIQIISFQLGLEKDKIDPNATLRSLGSDSLDDVELLMLFEKEYDMDIMLAHEIKKICETPSQIAEFLERRLDNINAQDKGTGSSSLSDSEIVDWLEEHLLSYWPYKSRLDISKSIVSIEPFYKQPTLREAVTRSVKEENND